MTSSPAPASAAVPAIEVQYPAEQLAAPVGIEITEWARAEGGGPAAPSPAGMPSSPAPESAAVPEIEVQYPDEQLAARMGIEITEWAKERVVGTMPVTGNRQP